MNPPPRRRLHLLSLLLGALSVAAVVGILALAGTFDGSDPERGAATAATTAAPPAASGGAPTSVADIYERVSPAVVFVQASGGSQGRSPLPIPGGSPEGAPRSTAAGSGVVMDTDGRTVTNQHMVDASRKIRCRFV